MNSGIKSKNCTVWLDLKELLFSKSKLLLNEWVFCCRKEDPLQGPKLGSCLTLGNELSEESDVLTKQEILLGKGTQVESSR